MLKKILSIITPQHGGTFIDCTFGAGGYSEAILKYPNTKVIAIDRDKKVKKYSEKIKKKYSERFVFFQKKFSDLEKLIKPETQPKAIIFDLGFSSLQLADETRGFSFKSKGPLDMRMGFNNFMAQEAINKLKKNELASIFRILGEEKDCNRVANKIVQHRSKKKITSVEDLVLIIKSAKKNYKKKKIDPSTKIFQALRIFVNKELQELLNGLVAATKILKKDGILIVVNFHSLEDKITKNFFKVYSNINHNLSRYIPQKENKKIINLFKLDIKKPLKPDLKEIEENSRSRSAKLRYGIRTKNEFFYSEEIELKFKKYFEVERLIL